MHTCYFTVYLVCLMFPQVDQKLFQNRESPLSCVSGQCYLIAIRNIEEKNTQTKPGSQGNIENDFAWNEPLATFILYQELMHTVKISYLTF